MSTAALTARERLVFALDYPSLDEARRGAARVCAHAGVLKVGLELFVRHGPEAAALAGELGASLFLDLKLHDIPATVARAVTSAGSLGCRYLTVHAGGGRRMLREAAETGRDAGITVVAVTVLTSLDDGDLAEVGVGRGASEQAAALAELAWNEGVRAFVCSPHEASALRAKLGGEALIITPGVRPGGAAAGDQKRVATPAAAIAAGADLLVVGRPIRDAADPEAAARAIASEIDAAVASAGRA